MLQSVVQAIRHRHSLRGQCNDGVSYQQVAEMDVTGTPPKRKTHRVLRSTSPAVMPRVHAQTDDNIHYFY